MKKYNPLIIPNPSRKDINNIIKDSKHNSVRFGATDSIDPTIYVWDGEVAHYFALEHTNILNVCCGGVYEKDSTYIQIDQLAPLNKSEIFTGWMKCEHKTEVINKCKRLFPKITEVRFSEKRLNLKIG